MGKPVNGQSTDDCVHHLLVSRLCDDAVVDDAASSRQESMSPMTDITTPSGPDAMPFEHIGNILLEESRCGECAASGVGGWLSSQPLGEDSLLMLFFFNPVAGEISPGGGRKVTGGVEESPRADLLDNSDNGSSGAWHILGVSSPDASKASSSSGSGRNIGRMSSMATSAILNFN